MESTNTNSTSADCVQVAVRVRPLIARERGCTDISVLCNTAMNEIIIDGGDDRRFTYNHVFDATSTQEEVYNACVIPLVCSAFEGYNATILAYGQTGSGKTYTMGTAGRVSTPSDIGIVPRFIEDIFVRKELLLCEHPGSTIIVQVSFIEVYGETVRDLLEMGQADKKTITVQTNEQGGVQINGQKLQRVDTAEELIEYLDNGSMYRVTGQTSMNAFSSRSHAIFTIYIDQEIAVGEMEGEKVCDMKQSKFHFVDLAGSERAGRTNASGQRFKEGTDINGALLVLGRVIRSLGDEKGKGTVPPYRESVLTRILMDSLGGNAKTLMIACVSPASDSLNETLGSLRYANSAKNIQNRPKVNNDKNTNIIQTLRTEIIRLQQELQQARTNGRDPGVTNLTVVAQQRALQNLEEQRAVQDERDREVILEDRVQHAEEEVKRLSEVNRTLRRQVEEERKRSSVLAAQLDVRLQKSARAGVELPDKPNYMGEEMTEQEFADMDYLLAAAKRRVDELEELVQHKNTVLQDLLHMNEQQNQRNVEDKMELIDLRSRTMLELELEAANRLREALVADKSDMGEKESQDENHSVFDHAVADIDSSMAEQQDILEKQIDTLLDGIRMRERELVQVKKQQAELETMTGQYEEQLRSMTDKINRIESEKRQLASEMDSLLRKKSSNPALANTDAVNRQHEQLESRLRSKNDEISVIKTQKRELERTIDSLRSTSRRISKLTMEIEEMKNQKVALQRSVEQSQREHKMQIEEKRKEISQLVRQTKQQTRQITDLQRDNKKVDSLLRSQIDQTALLRKQLKDMQLNADVQKREHERYNKEDQKRVRWLEKQLQLQSRKDVQINQLERRLEQKDSVVIRLKGMLKTREDQRQKTTRSKHVTRMTASQSSPADSDSGDRLEQAELEAEIDQAETELQVKVENLEEIERILQDNQFSEEEVLVQLRAISGAEAGDMLCVFYKRIADYMKELRELQMKLGDKDVAMSERERETQTLQRKLHTQKLQYDRVVSQIKEEYEGKLLQFEQHDRHDMSGVDTHDRIMRVYVELKKQYKILVEDYYAMKICRDRYRELYVSLHDLNDTSSVASLSEVYMGPPACTSQINTLLMRDAKSSRVESDNSNTNISSVHQGSPRIGSPSPGIQRPLRSSPTVASAPRIGSPISRSPVSYLENGKTSSGSSLDIQKFNLFLKSMQHQQSNPNGTDYANNPTSQSDYSFANKK